MFKIDNEKTKARKLKDHQERENKNKKDNRFLNYYDLKRGQTITIRLLPVSKDIPEESFSWKSHGPNIKSSEIDPIQCVWAKNKEKCLVCKKMFELKEDPDTEKQGEMLSGKYYTLAQVLVLDSPEDFELNESDDGNIVKLFWMPWAIKEMLDEDMFTGELTDINSSDIIIRKSIKNQRSDYSRSSWEEGEELPKEVMELFESGEAYLYDIDEFVPDVLNKVETKEWLQKAMDVIDSKESDDDDDVDERTDRKSKARKSSSKSNDDDDVEEDNDEDVKTEEKSSSGSKRSAQDVLNKYKNR